MFRKSLKYLFLFVVFVIVLPVGATAGWYWAKGWPPSWRAADWTAAGIAPSPQAHDEPIIQVYAARAARWKSMFAVHTWIVVKPRGAGAFTRYEVVGWGTPLRRDAYPVDGRWFSNEPDIVFDMRGPQAEPLIEKIEQAVARYPYGNGGSYTVWPGPNSNSFVAWVARQVPELGIELPPTAVGKDYVGDGISIARTPSGSGWQVSLGGYAGAAIGVAEGLELHVLGGTIGIDPQDLAVKLPGFGSVGLGTITSTLAGDRGATATER